MPDTTMTKHDKRGWEASTIIPLPAIKEKAGLSNEGPAPAELEISTSKHYNGGLRTNASVRYRTAMGFRTAISFGGGTYAETGGDYSRSVQTDPKARCTEKNVKAMHESSLGYLDAILADVARHYGVADPLAVPVVELA